MVQRNSPSSSSSQNRRLTRRYFAGALALVLFITFVFNVGNSSVVSFNRSFFPDLSQHVGGGGGDSGNASHSSNGEKAPIAEETETASGTRGPFFPPDSAKHLQKWDVPPANNTQWENDFAYWTTHNFTEAPQKLTLGDVHFIMTTGSCCRERATEVLTTWGAGIPKEQWLLISDETDEELGAVSTANTSGRASWQAAQERPFEAIRLIRRDPAYQRFLDSKWVIFIDDDTWFSTPALYTYLSKFDVSIPVMIGFVFTHTIFFSGGTGMILSRSAFRRVADLWDDPAYPDCHFEWNELVEQKKDGLDIQLSYCARAAGVQFVRNPFMYQRHKKEFRASLYRVVSLHYATGWMYELSYRVARNCSHHPEYVIDCWFPEAEARTPFHTFDCPEWKFDCRDIDICAHDPTILGCDLNPNVDHLAAIDNVTAAS